MCWIRYGSNIHGAAFRIKKILSYLLNFFYHIENKDKNIEYSRNFEK